MNIKIVYHCPTCTREYETEEQAEECKKRHGIVKKVWAVCSICGEKWNLDPASWGEKLAIEKAQNCEKKHQQ